MALVTINGAPIVQIGANMSAVSIPATNNLLIDAATESVAYIGRIATSDGASHTIDTSGSSSIGWRTQTATFANAGTTIKVGIGSVLTTAGPPGRADHASDVIAFDVAAVVTGGGGGITANAWQTSVPTTGTKTIANGDLVALSIQATAIAGGDFVNVSISSVITGLHSPGVTTFQSGSYGSQNGFPNCVITFSDGAIGYFYTSDVFSAIATQTFNSGSATKEYGQLLALPFPAKVYGLYGMVDPDNDFDMILYSDPLGTPVAEKTVSIDANTVNSASGRRIFVPFSSPYTTIANQPIGAVFKPGASNISVYYKTLASATHRAVDPWGTAGYGISRASGAFANTNSSLDHYYTGLLVGGFEHGVWPSYGMGI